MASRKRTPAASAEDAAEGGPGGGGGGGAAADADGAARSAPRRDSGSESGTPSRNHESGAGGAPRLNLTGVWREDKEESDSLEPLLVAMGVNWVGRKVVLQLKILSHITHEEDEITIADKSSVGTVSTTIPTSGEEVVVNGQDGDSRMSITHEANALTVKAVLPNDKGTTYDRRSLTSANCMEQHFRLERGGETIVTLHRIFRRAMDVDQPDHIMSDAEVAQLNAVAEGRSVDSAADSGDDDDDDEAVGGGPALSLAGVWQQSSSDPLVPWLRAMSVDDALAELFESLAGRVRIQHSPSYLIVTDVTPTGRVSTALALGRAEFEAVMPEPDDEPGTGDDEVAKLNTPVTLMRAVCVDGEVVIATKLPEECGGGVTLDSRRLTGPDTMASHTRLVRDGVVVAHLRRSFTRMADVPQPPGAVPSRAAFERAAAQFPAHADSGDEATGEELAAPSLAELAQAGEAADVDAAPAAARATDVVIEAPRASRKRWARGAGARDSPRGEDRDVVTPLPSTPATSVGTAASRPTPSLDAARRSRGHSSPSLQLQDYRLASVGVLGLLFFVVMGMFVFSGSLLYSGLFVFVAAEFVVRVYRSCTRKRRRSQAASKAPPQPATGNAVQATAATAPMVEAAGSD